MLNEKTTQKVLFVWLIFLFLVTTRVLLVTKVGALLVSLVIVAFSIWVAFRLVESAVAAAWKISGCYRFPADAEAGGSAQRGTERHWRVNDGLVSTRPAEPCQLDGQRNAARLARD